MGKQVKSNIVVHHSVSPKVLLASLEATVKSFMGNVSVEDMLDAELNLHQIFLESNVVNYDSSKQSNRSFLYSIIKYCCGVDKSFKDYDIATILFPKSGIQLYYNPELNYVPAISKLVDNAVLLHIDEDNISKLEYSSRQMSRLNNAKKGKISFTSFMDGRLSTESSKLFFIEEREELVQEIKRIYSKFGEIPITELGSLSRKYDCERKYIHKIVSFLGLGKSTNLTDVSGTFNIFDKLHSIRNTKFNAADFIHEINPNCTRNEARTLLRLVSILKMFYGNVHGYGTASSFKLEWD